MMNNSNYSKIASESNPLKLLFNPTFWIRHWFVLIVLILSVFIIASLWEFTVPDSENVDSLFNLSYLIYLIALGGILKAIFCLSSMEVENEYCLQIENGVLEKLRQIKRGNLLMDIKELPSLLPENQNSMSSRLFDHIITEANARKFESNLVTLQPYKEESFGRILEISNLQRIALLTGILGTFIGLIVAFRKLNHIDLDVSPIFNALEFSFGTSIAGLETAIILGAFVLLIRYKQERLFHIMEKASDSLLTLGRRAINKDEIMVEFDQLKTTIIQLNDTVENQNQEVRSQTNQIITGIDRLAATKQSFNGFLNDLTTQEKQFIKEVKEIYEHLSPEVIGKELQKNLGDSVKLISTTINSNLETTLKKYDDIHKYVVQLNDTLTLIKKNFEDHVKESSDVVLKSKKEIYKSVEEISKSQEVFLAQVSDTHLAEQIKGSILKAGEGMTEQYIKNLQTILPHIQKLEKELGRYNEITKEEITARTPSKIILQIITLVGRFSESILVSFIGFIKSIYNKIKT